MSISHKATLYKLCNMLTWKRNAAGAESMKNSDSHIILKRILIFPAQPSHFLGTMEKINTTLHTGPGNPSISSLIFVLSSNLVVATEWTKSRNRFV